MSEQPFPGPSAGEIGDLLRDHAEALGRMLFPHAVLAGGFLCIGSLQGEPGDSLKIQTRGPKRGTWADYATSDSDPRGKGDMLKLLQLTIGGGDFKRGIAEAKRFLNLDSMDPGALERLQEKAKKARVRQERSKASEDERKRRNAEGLWQAAAKLTPSSPPALYLAGRGIDFAMLGHLPGAIRFYAGLNHAETGKTLPAMVTKATLLEGRHAATHVTFLHYEAGKGWVKLPPIEQIDAATGEVKRVDASKKIFSPLYWGAHISLWKGGQQCKLADVRPGTRVFVSEGIEDGLSYAMADPEARVIAAMTLGNIGQLALPPQAGDLTLLAQNDSKPEPIAALEDAVLKQQRQARLHDAQAPRTVRLKYPPPGIKDWNDWLRAGETA